MENLVADPLQELFQAIADAPDKDALREPIIAAIAKYFGASRWGLYFIDQLSGAEDRIPAMVQRALSLDYNPVLRYVVQHHAAVHEGMIVSPGIWQTICPRADHGHVMLGPVIQHSQLVGGIAFTRNRNDAAFNAANLADLSAICLHLSTRLAALHAKSSTPELSRDRLTPRELQISELVAQGLTNKAIGTALCITENSVKQALKRMFRKLQVSSRAEMVAQLSVCTTK